MNKEKIIELARQSHVVPYIVRPEDTEYLNRLEEFAKLVRDDYSEEIEKRVMELDEPIATRVYVINKAIRK